MFAYRTTQREKKKKRTEIKGNSEFDLVWLFAGKLSRFKLFFRENQYPRGLGLCQDFLLF